MTASNGSCDICPFPFYLCPWILYRDNISELLLIVMLCNENKLIVIIKHSIEVKKTLYICTLYAIMQFHLYSCLFILFVYISFLTMYDTLIKAFITMHSDVDPEMSIDSCAKSQSHIKSMSTNILLAMNYIQNKTACYTLFAWSDMCFYGRRDSPEEWSTAVDAQGRVCGV